MATSSRLAITLASCTASGQLSGSRWSQGGATETGEKTYTITYKYEDGTEVTSFSSKATMPVSYVRGSDADSEVEIHYLLDGSRTSAGQCINTITGATSGNDYSSCIDSFVNATIPISVAENLIITLGTV